MPLSRAFLSLGISSELPLFCSAVPSPWVQVVARPEPVLQRDESTSGAAALDSPPLWDSGHLLLSPRHT